MPDKLRPPIFLFGNTRSGTTIVQKVIATHPDVVGWYEPNALWLYPDPGRIHDEFETIDATDKAKRFIRSRFLRYQKQSGNRQVMEKTPQNILRIPYVHEIFPEATFLFIVRNPFSFISSVEYKWQRPVTGRGIIRRLKDTPVNTLPYWVRRYVDQQFNKRILRRKYLSIWGPRYKGIQEDLQESDQLTIIARQWAIPSKKAEKDMAGFAEGQILRLKYEDFVDNPLSNLDQICAHCGLEMSADMARATTEMVKSDRKQKWQRFDPQTLAKILPEIRDEMKLHGYRIPTEITQSEISQQSSGLLPSRNERQSVAFEPRGN
ncbi:MAG: sulfotransferase family protein [Anaerolineales bacterium]|jgi:hypothetical protein